MTDKRVNLISASEAVKKFQLTYSTLNYYTNLGFLNVHLKQGNTRFYDLSELQERLSLITRLKNEGYPLRLIRKKFID